MNISVVGLFYLFLFFPGVLLSVFPLFFYRWWKDIMVGSSPLILLFFWICNTLHFS